MSRTKQRVPASEAVLTMLRNKHAGWVDFLAEYEPYARANPDDKWAQGQVRYAREEIKRIERMLGLAANRSERPAQ